MSWGINVTVSLAAGKIDNEWLNGGEEGRGFGGAVILP